MTALYPPIGLNAREPSFATFPDGRIILCWTEDGELEMPAMTMVFRADEKMIAKMSEGQDIEFIADRVEGKLTVTELK